MHRRMAVMALWISAVAIAVTACSSSATSSSSKSVATSSGSATATQASDAAGVAAAKAYLANVVSAPTSIGITTPLLRKPAQGKLIVHLLVDTPADQIVSADEAQAAAALGWQYKTIGIGSQTNGIETAFNAALALKPAPFGIWISGYPRALIETQLKEAQSKGIVVVDTATADPVAAPIIANIDGPAQQEIFAKEIAAEIVANSNGDAHVATFSISAYPVLTVFVDDLNMWLKNWCPACTNKVVNQQITDIGTTTPQSVVSTFEADPSLQYAVYSFGDISLGVDAALKTAGLLGKVQQVGQNPTLQDLADLRSKTALAYTGYDSAVVGWRVIDYFARASEGQSLSSVINVPLPSQLLTQQDIGSMVADSSGYFLAPTDYQAQFEKLWHV